MSKKTMSFLSALTWAYNTGGTIHGTWDTSIWFEDGELMLHGSTKYLSNEIRSVWFPEMLRRKTTVSTRPIPEHVEKVQAVDANGKTLFDVEVGLYADYVEMQVLSMPEEWRSNGKIVGLDNGSPLKVTSLDYPELFSDLVYLCGDNRERDWLPVQLCYDKPDDYFDKVVKSLKIAAKKAEDTLVIEEGR